MVAIEKWKIIQTFPRFFVFSVLLFSAGCVNKAPVIEEYNLAEVALRAAKDSEARRYSPKIFAKAKKYMKLGQKAYKQRYYNKANEYFRKCRYYSEKAEEISQIKIFKERKTNP